MSTISVFREYEMSVIAAVSVTANLYKKEKNSLRLPVFHLNIVETFLCIVNITFKTKHWPKKTLYKMMINYEQSHPLKSFPTV